VAGAKVESERINERRIEEGSGVTQMPPYRSRFSSKQGDETSV
jgi:hypothetical protein